jgi:hypothetical protein
LLKAFSPVGALPHAADIFRFGGNLTTAHCRPANAATGTQAPGCSDTRHEICINTKHGF